MHKIISRTARSFGAFHVGLLLAFSVTLGAFLSAPTAFAACDSVNIVQCGLTGSTTQNYIDAIKKLNSTGTDGYGHNDMAYMLNWGGFSPSVVSGMNTTNTKVGTLYRDGHIVVGGKTVATATWLTARFGAGKTGFYQVRGDVYKRLTTTSMQNASDTVLITFDASGKAIAGTVVHCGNMLQFTPTPPAPKLTCDLLTKTARADGRTWDFKINATPTNNTINGYKFSWGDGTSSTSTTNTAYHTYAAVTKPTTFTVIGYVKSDKLSYVTSSTCQTTLTVNPPAPTPAYSCKSLTATKISRTEFKFLTTASATNGATISGYTYNFGDGTITNGTSTINHSYAKAGTYPVSVVVHVNVNGKTVDLTNCKTSVTVERPVYECVQLSGPTPKDLTYTFIATAKTTEGAKLLSGSFDFGDGNKAAGVKAVGSTVTTTHTYEREGKYSVLATLTFMVDGQEITAPTCRAAVEPNAPPVPECKPGIPVGDERCNPCQYDSSLPAGDVRCVAPPEVLPNTGSGNIIALGLAALVAGFLFYRNRIFRQHKAAFEAAEVGAAPLPLADPMSDQPLEQTPLATQTGHRSTLRRRRQF